MRSHLPTLERLSALVDAFRDRQLLLVADLVVDRFLVGRPSRISREAPVLILEEDHEVMVPGGGANAVANVGALGGTPVLIGAVGDDIDGRALLLELERRSIHTGSILVRADYRTPTKTRILAGSATTIRQQIVRIDGGSPRPLNAQEHADVLARTMAAVQALPSTPRVVVFSDYGYGTVEPDMLPAVIGASGTGTLVLVDSRYRLGEFKGIYGMTPNQEEAEALAGSRLDSESALLAAGKDLLARFELELLLITQGSRGMALFAKEGCSLIPVFGSAQVADVTGAGDTVIGTLSLALAAGASPLEAALLANLAGGLVVMKTGTATIGPEELRGAVTQAGQVLKEVRWVPS